MKRTLEGGSGGGGREEAGGVTPSSATIGPLWVSTYGPGVRYSAGKRGSLCCASCVKSRAAAEEKQIADLSGTGPQCV